MESKKEVTMIVDFEGYSMSKFYVKEIAFYNMNTNISKNYFIKTKKFNNSNYFWLVKYYHKIPYWYGFYKISYIINILNNKKYIFVVKDFEKFNIIRRFTSNKIIIINNSPSFFNLSESRNFCSFHSINCNKHCALNKVNRIAEWYGPLQKCSI